MLLETYSTLSADEMTPRLPHFLGDVQDVTGVPEYSMFNLSLHEDWDVKDSKFCHNIAGKLEIPEMNSTNGRRISECDSDYWDGGSDGRRLSECDSEWDHWQRKMVPTCTTPEEEVKNMELVGADDLFYEDMDRKYNGSRNVNGDHGDAVNGGSGDASDGGKDGAADNDSGEEKKNANGDTLSCPLVVVNGASC